MADAGGHWNNLAEAQKLTQGTLVPGIIEEDIQEGGLIGRLPVMQVPDKRLFTTGRMIFQLQPGPVEARLFNGKMPRPTARLPVNFPLGTSRLRSTSLLNPSTVTSTTTQRFRRLRTGRLS